MQKKTTGTEIAFFLVYSMCPAATAADDTKWGERHGRQGKGRPA